MKKLVIMVLPMAIGMAAFTVGCTTTSVEEDDYDNGIQVIDKDEIQNPRDKGRVAKILQMPFLNGFVFNLIV